MESPESCTICDSKAVVPYRLANGFQMFECGGCKLISTDLQKITPELLKEFYSNDYYFQDSKGKDTGFGYGDYLKDAKTWEKNARAIIKLAKRQFPKGKKLKSIDVGCAHGFLVKAANDLGIEGWGIDFSGDAVKFATEEMKLKNVLFGDFKTYPLEKGTYDIVILNGSLEHFTHPLEALERCYELLAPGGVLVDITIHHRCGLLGWVTLKPPEHLHYFNCANLRQIHERAGFKDDIKIKTYFKFYPLGQYFKMVARIIPYPFKWLAGFKFFAKFSMLCPTNEVIVLARKPA